jgi:large conductance mechanosensitive channel
MWNEFKAFINQGNVMSLAVGVIIGGAAGKIIDSVVNDLLMPIIARVTGTVDYSNMFVPLAGQTASVLAEAKKLGPVLAYGNFLTIVINFLILAFCVFLMVKWVASIMPKPAPAPPPGPSEVDLLKEIRDALVKGRAASV